MSQELNIFLKKKDDPNLEVTLTWYSTTPSRTIQNETGYFEYTSEDKKIDEEYLTEVIAELNEIITNYKKTRKEYLDRRDKYNNLLGGAANKEAFECLEERIFDLDRSIEEWDEMIEEKVDMRNDLEFCKEVYKNNTNMFDIYFTNC